MTARASISTGGTFETHEEENGGEEHDMVITQDNPGILILPTHSVDRDAQDQGSSDRVTTS